MTPNATEISGFDILSRVVSGASICVSLLLGWVIVTSIRPGFYGGTALFLVLALVAQFMVLTLVVGLPAVILWLCDRLRMSWLGWLLFGIAVLAAIGESVAVAHIPVTGNC